MTRKDRIRNQMKHLEQHGIIQTAYTYAPGDRYGTRWVFTPCGYTERSLSTSQIEDFILGAYAAMNAADRLAAV